ncbi:MAG: hypothetical protein ACOYT9_01405 [Patescibacteria group bacterium]
MTRNDTELLPGFTRYSLERYYQYMTTQGNRIEAAFTIIHLAELSVIDADFALDVGKALDIGMKEHDFEPSRSFVEAQNALSDRIREERKSASCRVSSQPETLAAARTFVSESTFKNRQEYIQRYMAEFRATRK